jgi:acetylglutamate kinase
LKSNFSEGMLPKVQAALEAVEAGARTVRIIDGTNDMSFEQALSGHGGTLVRA